MALPPHTPLVLLAAIAGSAVAFFVWQFRDTPGATPLAAFLMAASLWSLAEGLRLASPGVGAKFFWTQVVWTVSPVVPLAWLATALAYTGREDVLTRPRLAALAVEPAAFVALVWTSGSHDLVWQWTSTVFAGGAVAFTETFGIAFWAHIAYSYGLVALGAFYLVRQNFRTARIFRSGGTALLVAAFVPLLANALSIFHLLPPVYDLTSIGFVLGGMVITVALLRGKLMTVSPVTRELGRETLLDELDDQVLIVDEDDQIVDVNPAAARLLNVDHERVVGEPLSSVSPDLAESLDALEAGSTSLELATDGGVRYFDARVSPLYRGYRGVAGRLVSLRDVTERERREQRLDVLNRLLRHNLRNEMNVVRGNAELLAEELDAGEDAHARLDRIADTVDTVIERSDKVGRLARVVESDRPTADQRADDGTALEDLCESVAAAVREDAPDATITVEVPAGLTVDAGASLRFAVEELLENAVEHGGSDPTVTLSARRTGEGFAALDVADDGPGIPEQERAVIEAGRETELEHGSGVGLWLVAWIVRAAGGRIAFENREDGCTVTLELPLAEATRESDTTARPISEPST